MFFIYIRVHMDKMYVHVGGASLTKREGILATARKIRPALCSIQEGGTSLPRGIVANVNCSLHLDTQLSKEHVICVFRIPRHSAGQSIQKFTSLLSCSIFAILRHHLGIMQTNLFVYSHSTHLQVRHLASTTMFHMVFSSCTDTVAIYVSTGYVFVVCLRA